MSRWVSLVVLTLGLTRASLASPTPQQEDSSPRLKFCLDFPAYKAPPGAQGACFKPNSFTPPEALMIGVGGVKYVCQGNQFIPEGEKLYTLYDLAPMITEIAKANPKIDDPNDILRRFYTTQVANFLEHKALRKVALGEVMELGDRAIFLLRRVGELHLEAGSSCPAPAHSNQGEDWVEWQGSENMAGFKIYKVGTVGGQKPPATCQGGEDFLARNYATYMIYGGLTAEVPETRGGRQEKVKKEVLFGKSPEEYMCRLRPSPSIWRQIPQE